MSYARIGALILFVMSIGCASCGIIVGVAPLFTEIRQMDGTIASPGIGLLTGGLILVVALMLITGGAVLWWIVHPQLSMRTTDRQTLDHLREIALHSYFDWLTALQFVRSQHPADAVDRASPRVRARILGLLATLDPQRKQQLIKFLSDLQFFNGPDALDLSSADLRGVDRRILDLPEAPGRPGALIDPVSQRQSAPDLREQGAPTIHHSGGNNGNLH